MQRVHWWYCVELGREVQDDRGNLHGLPVNRVQDGKDMNVPSLVFLRTLCRNASVCFLSRTFTEKSVDDMEKQANSTDLMINQLSNHRLVVHGRLSLCWGE
jgi:hypothetical protein